MISIETLDEFLTKNRRRHPHFNVAPRYSPGSPALVNQYLALRVAADEEGMFQHASVGRYGTEYAEKAKELGLAGIVEARVETKKGWDILDLLTGERFIRPFKKPQ